jgi:hypothetical protein
MGNTTGSRVRSRPGRAALAALAVLLLATGLVAPAPSAAAAPRLVYTYEVRGLGNTTSLEDFAARAAQTYADPRGWGLWGQIEFRRVSSGGSFTLWLAAPSTLPSFSSGCSTQWSCRVGRNVVINELRFRTGTTTWNSAGGSLRDYQHMVVNHETGHWLGFGHSSCPAAGQPAPVMQQQSKGLQGCRPNPWPTARELASAARARGLSPVPLPPPGPPPVPARTTVTVPVGAAAAAAKAVGVNLTVVAPAAAGWAVAYPCGQPVPPTSSLNYAAGQTVAGFAVVGVGTGGAVCVQASSAAHLVVDLTGALPATASYRPNAPARLLDTRSRAAAPPAGPVSVALPAGAAAAALTVTVTRPVAGGWLVVHPCGAPAPLASNLNFRAGQDVANTVLAKSGQDGRVCVRSSAPAHIVVDLAGTWPDESGFRAQTPRRLLDTREGGGPRTGLVKVPLPGAGTHALNLTVLGAGAGWASAYPCGTAFPGTSSSNFVAGQVVANAVIGSAGPDGSICVQTSAPAHVIVDDAGAFGPAEFVPQTPRRLLDTRQR